MNADQVVNKILSDANDKAEKIKAQARQKEDAEQKRFDGQLEEYKKETEQMASKKANDEKEHRMAAGRMDAAKAFLAEKRKMLDEAFDKAKDALAKMPDEEYLKLVGKWIAAAAESGDEEVIVDKNENRIDESFLKQVSRQLGEGKKQELKLADERLDLGGGGFILSTGKVRTNVSLNVLISQIRDEAEAELAGMLFGNDSSK